MLLGRRTTHQNKSRLRPHSCESLLKSKTHPRGNNGLAGGGIKCRTHAAARTSRAATDELGAIASRGSNLFRFGRCQLPPPLPRSSGLGVLLAAGTPNYRGSQGFCFAVTGQQRQQRQQQQRQQPSACPCRACFQP
eukprot:366039-Chlamydomonas_euryale.AAC.16